MSGLEVRGEQKNEAGVGVVRRGTVGVVPEHVAEARGRRTKIGVRIVTVDAPRLQHACP